MASNLAVFVIVSMLSTDCSLNLYRPYRNDLRAVRTQQYWFHRRHENALVRRQRKLRVRRDMVFPALDYPDAESNDLLTRARCPKAVVKISPNAGWSTRWIISSLHDDDDGGRAGRSLSATMIRKSVFDAIGGFDERFKLAGLDDHELWTRVAAATKIAGIPEPLTHHRKRE